MARLSWAVALVPAFVFCASPASGDEPVSRALVLETEPPALVALALDTGATLGRFDLKGTPGRAHFNPDGSRLVVLDRGPGRDAGRHGYHPTGRSWATVLDGASLQVVGRAELCWSVALGAVGPLTSHPGVFAPGGRRLSLPCFGFGSQKPAERLPREIVNLDLDTGQVTGRVEVPRAIDALLGLPGGTTAVVYSGREAPKNEPALPAELRFVDLDTLAVTQTLTLEGDPDPPALAPGGEYLYLLEQGRPDKKPQKNVNGRVQVVSVARRAHEVNLDAGRAPRGLVLDDETGLVYLLSEGAPSVEKKDDLPGELRVIRGPELAATIPVGEDPMFLRVTPDRERLYVVSEKALTSVDVPALSAEGTSVLKPAKVGLLGKGRIKELEISSDGRRAYALYAQSSKLSILDLADRKVLAEINTGRGGVKFGKLLAAVALTALSHELGRSAAVASGSPVFFYTVHRPTPANTAVVLSSDEKFVYVLNTHSNDVTIVDTHTHQVVTKIGVGGSANRLELLPGGAFVAVTTGADTLHLIDTRTHKKVSELPDGGNYRHSPDRRYAAAVGKNLVHCLDGATLKTLGSATGFKKPIQVVFAPAPPPTAPPAP